MKKESRKTSKAPWTDFEITRIRLEPEQAVLSCCDNVARSLVGGTQCDILCGEPTADGVSS